MQRSKILLCVIELSASLVRKVAERELRCDLLFRLFMRAHNAIVLELLFLPVKTCHCICLMSIFKNTIAQSTNFATVRNLLSVSASHVNLARLLKDNFGCQILIRWCVLWVKRALRSNCSMLGAHCILVTILCIRGLKVIQDLLLNCDPIAAFPRLNFLCSNL